MTICEHCNSEYEKNSMDIPNPIPDFMCSFCGTQLTKEQVEELISNIPDSNGILDYIETR